MSTLLAAGVTLLDVIAICRTITGNKVFNQVWDDMEHRVPELIEFATGIMTMNSGDVLSCGTNHEGLGNLQEGETCVIASKSFGSFSFIVTDPLKRKWERGIYKGENSTYRGP